MAGTDYQSITLDNIIQLRKIFSSFKKPGAKLTKSIISPADYFENLSYSSPPLKHVEAGISKTIITICELIATLLLEDMEENRPIAKTIVMIFEYYFLVSPLLFKRQDVLFVNDVIFMLHFMKYIHSLCSPKNPSKKELGNLLVALELHDPLRIASHDQ